MRAGLGINGQAARFARRYFFDRATSGNMADKDRRFDQFREADGAVGRLTVADRGMSLFVIAKLRLAGRDELFRQPADAGVVLGMDHHHRALGPGKIEDVQDLVVIELQPIIGQVDLHRGAAFGDQRRNLVAKHLGRRIADNQMNAVVYIAPSALLRS